MNEKFVSMGVIAWTLPLACAVHRNTGDIAQAGLWLLVALWIAWRLWKDWPVSVPASPPPTTTPLASIAALACWAACAWIVSGLWPEDHGLLRVLLPMLVAAWLVILWGPRHFLHGWRVLLIAVFWVVNPFLYPLDHLFAGPRIETLTAALSSFGLWQIGVDVARDGAQITTDAGSVIVKYGCTAIPLWALVLHLLVPAGLVFSLSARRLLLLAGVSLCAGFVISIVRVMIMAVVVNNDARFQYWHGDEGGAWFTLATFAVFAALLVRLARPVARTSAPPPVHSGTRFLVVAGAAFSLLAVARMLASGTPTHATDLDPPRELGSWEWVATETLPLPDAHLPGDRPEWIRRFSYIEKNEFTGMTVTVAPVPVWLNGDPLYLAALWRRAPARHAPQSWQPVALPAPAPTDARALQRGSGWLASIHQSGAVVCESSVWVPLTKRLPANSSAWLDWLLGRAPLRQKAGLWIALETSPAHPLTTEQASAVLARWRDRYLAAHPHP